MKTQLLAVGFALAFSNAYAANKSDVNCDDANTAKAYATSFNARAKLVIDKGKAREKLNQQNYENLRDKIILAGVWNAEEAGNYLLKLTSTMPDLRELEAMRLMVVKDLQTIQQKLAGVPASTAGNEQAEHRAVCILGQQSLEYLFTMQAINTTSWEIVNKHVTLFGKEKGVAGF